VGCSGRSFRSLLPTCFRQHWSTSLERGRSVLASRSGRWKPIWLSRSYAVAWGTMLLVALLGGIVAGYSTSFRSSARLPESLSASTPRLRPTPLSVGRGRIFQSSTTPVPTRCCRPVSILTGNRLLKLSRVAVRVSVSSQSVRSTLTVLRSLDRQRSPPQLCLIKHPVALSGQCRRPILRLFLERFVASGASLSVPARLSISLAIASMNAVTVFCPSAPLADPRLPRHLELPPAIQSRCRGERPGGRRSSRTAVDRRRRCGSARLPPTRRGRRDSG